MDRMGRVVSCVPKHLAAEAGVGSSTSASETTRPKAYDFGREGKMEAAGIEPAFRQLSVAEL
jgi:hypothetical protein